MSFFRWLARSQAELQRQTGEGWRDWRGRVERRGRDADWVGIRRDGWVELRQTAAWLPPYLVLSPYFYLADLRALSALIFLVAALLGLWISPMWFSLHLLDIINSSSILQVHLSHGIYPCQY